MQARRDLLCSYARFGDIAYSEGQLSEARAYYEKTLAIAKPLAEETKTVEDCRDLSVGYEKLGNKAEGEGQLAEAKGVLRKIACDSDNAGGGDKDGASPPRFVEQLCVVRRHSQRGRSAIRSKGVL